MAQRRSGQIHLCTSINRLHVIRQGIHQSMQLFRKPPHDRVLTPAGCILQYSPIQLLPAEFHFLTDRNRTAGMQKKNLLQVGTRKAARRDDTAKRIRRNRHTLPSAKALSEKSLQKVHTVRIRKAQPHAPADLAVRSVFFNEAVKHLSENAPALKVLKARPRGTLFRIFSSFHNSTHAARALPHSPLPPASSRSTGTA